MRKTLKSLILKNLSLIALFFGLLNSVHADFGIILNTDSMGDDITAYYNFFNSPRYAALADKTVVVLVSTGNAIVKAAMVSEAIAASGRKIPVILGSSSDLSKRRSTRFSAGFVEEGKFIVPEIDRLAYTSLSLVDQGADPLDELESVLIKAKSQGKKLHYLGMSAYTDLARMLEAFPELTKDTLGIMATMGMYKNQSSGEMSIPFNGDEDPVATAIVSEHFQNGTFTDLIVLPSDTLSRVGLENGYFPKDEELKKLLEQRAEKDPFLKKLWAHHGNYNANWRNAGVAEAGLTTSWLGSSFVDSADSHRTYLADPLTLVAFLKFMNGEPLDVVERNIVFQVREVGTSASDGKKLIVVERPKARAIKEIHSLDGMKEVRVMAEDLANAPAPQALKAQMPINLSPRQTLRVETAKEKILEAQKILGPQSDISAIGPIEAFMQNLFKHPKFDNQKTNKSIVMVFKNSPDDYAALLMLLTDPLGRAALKNGGIIAEGFDAKGILNNLHALLKDFEVSDITVALGHSYTDEEVKGNGNLAIEERLNKNALVSAAFEDVIKIHGVGASTLTAAQLLDRVKAHVLSTGEKAIGLVLGEGVDILNDPNEALAKYRADQAGEIFKILRDMGGGRSAGEKYNITRNWSRNPVEMIDAYTRLGAQTKVVVYDSTNFSGSLFHGKVGEEEVGKGNSFFSLLREASRYSPALKAIYQHSINWTRNFLHWKALAKNADAKLSDQALIPDGIMVGVNSIYMVDDLLLIDLYDIKSLNDEALSDIEALKMAGFPKEIMNAAEGEVSKGLYWAYRHPSNKIESLIQRRVMPGVKVLVESQQRKHLDELVRRHGVGSPQVESFLREIGMMTSGEVVQTSPQAPCESTLISSASAATPKMRFLDRFKSLFK